MAAAAGSRDRRGCPAAVICEARLPCVGPLRQRLVYRLMRSRKSPPSPRRPITTRHWALAHSCFCSSPMYGAPGYSTVSYGPGGSVSTTTTTYGAPMMAPPMMMAGPPMMAPPMMAPPMMAGPMGYPAPPSMWRSQLNWNDAYSRSASCPHVLGASLTVAQPDALRRPLRPSSGCHHAHDARLHGVPLPRQRCGSAWYLASSLASF